MLTMLCFSNDFSDFEGFLNAIQVGSYTHAQLARASKKYIPSYLLVLLVPKKGHQQCMSLSTDSLSADENDYVNSACKEKRKLISLYHKPVSAVTSKRRSSCSGPSKMEDLPEQEDKRSISKSNKKRCSQFMRKVTETLTKSS